MTEIRPLYSQPFKNHPFHLPIILESVTCQVLLQWSELHYGVLWAVKWCRRLITCQMPFSIMTEIFKLLPIWGKCMNMLREYDKKSRYFGRKSDLHWRLWRLLTGAKEQRSITYLLHITCRFQKHLTAVVQKLWTHKKQHKIPIKKFTFFCVMWCGYIKGWTGPVRRSLIIHSLSHLFLFANGRFSTISLSGANTVSPFRGTQTMW